MLRRDNGAVRGSTLAGSDLAARAFAEFRYQLWTVDRHATALSSRAPGSAEGRPINLISRVPEVSRAFPMCDGAMETAAMVLVAANTLPYGLASTISMRSCNWRPI